MMIKNTAPLFIVCLFLSLSVEAEDIAKQTVEAHTIAGGLLVAKKKVILNQTLEAVLFIPRQYAPKGNLSLGFVVKPNQNLYFVPVRKIKSAVANKNMIFIHKFYSRKEK